MVVSGAVINATTVDEDQRSVEVLVVTAMLVPDLPSEPSTLNFSVAVSTVSGSAEGKITI